MTTGVALNFLRCALEHFPGENTCSNNSQQETYVFSVLYLTIGRHKHKEYSQSTAHRNSRAAFAKMNWALPTATVIATDIVYVNP
jgi:hypothetical protein